jgi:DNA-binding beta-propeller fold protein YncE
VAAGVGAFAPAVSPDGKSVYVSNAFGASVSQFDVGAGGRLSPKIPAMVAAGIQPIGVAVSPDGKSVYVTDTAGDKVFQYDVGAGGALSPKTPGAVAAGIHPVAVAVSPLPRVPTSKDQCKDGGWRDYPGFKNQGDCVSFVATGGRNPPGAR